MFEQNHICYIFIRNHFIKEFIGKAKYLLLLFSRFKEARKNLFLEEFLGLNIHLFTEIYSYEYD